MVKKNQKKTVARTRKSGRRSKKNQATLDGIIEAIRIGITFERAADLHRVSRATVYRWRNEDPEFDKDILEAVVYSEAVLVQRVNDKSIDDWKAAAWMLERRHPEQYSQRREIDVTVSRSDGKDEVVAMMEQTRELYLGAENQKIESEDSTD
jgi:hypothetical protein